MEHEHLHNAESELEKAATRPAAPRPADATLEQLRQLQHGIGNRALGQLVQAKRDDGAGRDPDGLTDAVNLDARPSSSASSSSAGDGRPLGEGERVFFESRFREDFGAVRLHTGGAASESARSIGARAYAAGQDLVFADGQYAPHTEPGMRLLAHELAHVVQQRRAGAGGGGGASAESSADAAAEAVAAGHAVRPHAVGAAAPGLYADNGFTLAPSAGLKFPPLKLSRKLFLYLIENNLLTPEMRGMILRGEVVIEDDKPAVEGPAPAPAPGAAPKLNLLPWSEYDDLLRRAAQKRAAEEQTAQGAAGPQPLTPSPYKPPDDKPKLLDWKGLMDGLDFNLPYAHKLPPALKGLANPNLSVSGLTVPVVKVGQFDSKLVAGFDQSLEVKLAYRDWHLSGSVDTDGKWQLKLSYPNDSPVTAGGSLDSIFSQGETALREMVRTAAKADLTKFDELKEKVSTLASPLKSAADAGKGIFNFDPRRVNISIAVGAGPPPGRVPSSALQGQPQPKPPAGLYTGLRLDFLF